MPVWTADDDTAINYEVHGAAHGETLLLLPGLLGSLGQWQRFIQPLSAGFRVILMDLRGHGRSENKQPALEPARMAQDIAGLLDHLGVEQVHVAGYSLGGYLGLMLHLSQPRRVCTLLLHATKFYWSGEAVARMRQHPALAMELSELFDILDDQADHVPEPLDDQMRWPHRIR